MKKAASVLLLLLFLAGTTPFAAAYTDLPSGHWAYADMSRAVECKLMTGLPDGSMRPDAPLSWGEWLTLMGRAFYPGALQTSSDAEHWAAGALRGAEAVGVVQQGDFLSVTGGSLDRPVTRQETAVLLDRVLRNVKGLSLTKVDVDLAEISDLDDMPETYRGPVLQCYARGIVTGREDGSFGGGESLTRGAGAVLLMRALDRTETGTGQTAPENSGAWGQSGELPPVSVQPGDGLRELGSNDEKLTRLFGTAQQSRYATEEEAGANMTQVTVPVWKLSRETGEKTGSTITFTVHAAIADDMTAVFTEIYNDPEQFPIYSVEGYAWRGASATGEHNCGTAVDITANENYQVYPDGRVGAGSHWTPGEDPWSIPEDGSVVRIFRSYGYSWGGNAWPTNRDYMHFSYLGV